MRGLYGGVHVWGTCSLTGKFWARHFSAKLFVGGLSYDTNEPVLKAAFEKHGDILEVKVICDHKSGRSKGYGFVHFTSEAAATDALKEIDGQLLDGRNIRLQFAHERLQHEFKVDI
ncbi:glycine-rich RNA-binding protein 4, mitochondrial [Cannabis sativa]|uniref:glycine-rich RNA-binding protein 4, mitochondrial n=1 Tax=Cannabis sativa TaxID=3483 RepID=UPI0029CA23D3|nr:glycine-rich RNA-binding protein 4, mitochondrial [Cannabis sativa]XP_030504036.2 glycine-rich RNA-binding protein 4, mitochondrial [Cannabis sativa]XP_030504037.2 glycine-rich RNA-binding protein 4, mitochondrial [Cannabis sativa]XP_030504038.2 glycine-rich RNA-binding protein 4, mitochondrial [Cannabis sativa]XP_060966749.1 glycine-rich RNA-binding protein 4, mitochondrial [Cannabis sativa]